MLKLSFHVKNHEKYQQSTYQKGDYIEPFKADKRKVIALAVELNDLGKGLIDWKEVEEA